MTENYTIVITSNGDFIAGQGPPEEMIKTWCVSGKEKYDALCEYLNTVNDWQRQKIFYANQPWSHESNWPDEIKEVLKSED
tara:strand:- start:8916 stop:9158 length:243 start_codon:yes stop_codon:yes gene_type:complete